MAAPSDHAAWREAVRGHRTGELAALATLDYMVVESFVEEAWQSTALQWAAGYGWLDMVQVLTRDCGANAEALNKYGATPLHNAAANNRLDVAKYLTGTAGANVETADKDGARALHTACQNGHLEVVQYLIRRAGANVETAMTDGATSLFMASQEGHLEVVQYLVDTAGASVEAANTDGATPLFIACQNGHLEVVRYLAARANVEAVMNNGWRPIHISAQEGHADVVGCLLQRGADRLAQTTSAAHDDGVTFPEGSTALDMARLKGHEAIVTLLAESPVPAPAPGVVPESKIDTADLVTVGRYHRTSQPISGGAFGSVFPMWTVGDAPVQLAGKLVPLSGALVGHKQQLLAEAQLLAALEHPNIVRLTEAFLHENASLTELWIVTEYCAGGSLCSVPQEVSGAVFDEIVKQTLRGLVYLHQQVPSIQHFDIKPDNICLKSRLSAASRRRDVLVKLVDFGAAEEVMTQVRSARTGTRMFFSPERLDPECDSYDLKDDVWAAGVSLLFAGVGLAGADAITSEAARGLSGSRRYSARLEELLRLCESTRGAGATAVLRGMLARDPAGRLSAAYALEMIDAE